MQFPQRLAGGGFAVVSAGVVLGGTVVVSGGFFRPLQETAPSGCAGRKTDCGINHDKSVFYHDYTTTVNHKPLYNTRFV